MIEKIFKKFKYILYSINIFLIVTLPVSPMDKDIFSKKIIIQLQDVKKESNKDLINNNKKFTVEEDVQELDNNSSDKNITNVEDDVNIDDSENNDVNIDDNIDNNTIPDSYYVVDNNTTLCFSLDNAREEFLTDDIYMIKSVIQDLFFTVNDDGQVILSELKNKPNQLFNINYSSNEYCNITNQDSLLNLAIKNGNSVDGTEVIEEDSTEDSAKWLITKSDDYSYVIINILTGKVLTIDKDCCEEGSKICQTSFLDNEYQKWLIVKK